MPIILFGFIANGQNISENALGLRLGSNNGFGSEISYQRKLSSNNRLELDLGWRSSHNINATKLTGLYQWVWNIDKGFNWYAGVGGGIGNWRYNNVNYSDSGVILFAAGDIGIEYNFSIPLQLALDFRPELYINKADYREDNLATDVALSVRYKF